MGFKLKIGNKSGQGTTGFSLKHMNNIVKSPSMAPNYNANTLKKNGSPFFEIDPETGVERVMGKKTTTTTKEKVDDGTNIHTDTTQAYTDISGGKSYSEAGVSKEEGEEYWRNNPEARKEYEASLRKPGEDKNRTTEFVPDPKTPPETTTTPKEPKPAQLVNASLTKPSTKNASGKRGVANPGKTGQQNTDFKNLTPKQIEALKQRNAANNAQNEQRNLKTRKQLIKDRGWSGTLNPNQKAWITKTLADKNRIYNNNKSTLKMNN